MLSERYNNVIYFLVNFILSSFHFFYIWITITSLQADAKT